MSIVNHTKIEEYIAIFVSVNAIVQFIADALVEGLKYVPTRVNHLGLTLLNAFVSFKSLSAIRKRKFRFLHEDIQTLILLEILLIFGDVFYILDEGWDEQFFYVRLGFVVLSFFNLTYAICIMIKYELYHITYQGGGAPPSNPTRHPSSADVISNNNVPVRHMSAPPDIIEEVEVDIYIDDNDLTTTN